MPSSKDQKDGRTSSVPRGYTPSSAMMQGWLSSTVSSTSYDRVASSSSNSEYSYTDYAAPFQARSGSTQKENRPLSPPLSSPKKTKEPDARPYGFSVAPPRDQQKKPTK